MTPKVPLDSHEPVELTSRWRGGHNFAVRVGPLRPPPADGSTFPGETRWRQTRRWCVRPESLAPSQDGKRKQKQRRRATPRKEDSSQRKKMAAVQGQQPKAEEGSSPKKEEQQPKAEEGSSSRRGLASPQGKPTRSLRMPEKERDCFRAKRSLKALDAEARRPTTGKHQNDTGL